MSQSAINIIDRLKEELSINTDKNLCKLIDIKPNTLSTWKKRDSLDFNKVIALCESKNLDLNYIFFNEKNFSADDEKEISSLKTDTILTEPPEVEIFKEFQLINTNRNIALFQSIHSYHPTVHSNSVVMGQKIRKNQTTDGVIYIIKFETEELIVDELQKSITNKKTQEFTLRNYHPFDHAIQPKKHIKHIWQYIDVIENVTIN